MEEHKKTKSIKYQSPNFNPELLDKENIDRLALDAITPKSIVLDIGCATGFMGKYLIEKKQCKVYGIDIRDKELVIAKKNLTGVAKMDIENTDIKNIKKLIKNNSLDFILSTSTIEHLRDVDKFLILLKKIMSSKTKLIITTPNIAHWTMRVSLLRGKFDYTEYGILDNTHLHFFTMKTLKELFIKHGFVIDRVAIDSVGGGYPRISRFLSRFFPNIFAYQIMILASRKN